MRMHVRALSKIICRFLLGMALFGIAGQASGSEQDVRRLLDSLKGGAEIEATALGRLRLTSAQLVLRRGALQGAISFPTVNDAREALKKLKRLNPEKDLDGHVNGLERPSLDFVNAYGKIEKRIFLGDSKVDRPNGHYQYLTTQATATKDRQRIAFVESETVEVASSPARAEASEDPLDTSTLKVFSTSTGEVLWEKDLPQFRAIREFQFSSDGKRLVTVQSWSKVELYIDRLPERQFVIYDVNGDEIFEFPKSREYWLGEFCLSPSGRYIAVQAHRGDPRRPVSLALDINEKRIWEKEGAGYVKRIFDDGTLIDNHKAKINFSADMKLLDEK